MIALGDVVERCLRACGITKERLASVTGVADCGCDKRREALNQAGYTWQRRIMLPVYSARDLLRLARYSSAGRRVAMSGRHLYLAARVLFWGT